MTLGDALPLLVLLGRLRGRTEALTATAGHLARAHAEANDYRTRQLAAAEGDQALALDRILAPLTERFGALGEQLRQAADVDAQQIAGAERAALRAVETIEAERRALVPFHVRVGSAAAGAARGARAGWKRA